MTNQAETVSDPLSAITDRYPALGQVLEAYIRRLQSLAAEEMRASWLWGAAWKAATTQDHPLDAYFQEWDSIAGLLDEESVQALSRRFSRTVPEKAPRWRGEYNDAFLEVCSEMSAYGWLRREKCQVVSFIEEGTSRQPDLLGNKSVVVECKHFRTSQKDREYFEHYQGEAWSVDGDTVNKLLDKVLNTFKNDVLPKFAEYPPQTFERYLFADFSFDVELWGPIEGASPGTISSLIDTIRQHLAKHQVKLAAVRDHSLRQPLTPMNFGSQRSL